MWYYLQGCTGHCSFSQLYYVQRTRSIVKAQYARNLVPLSFSLSLSLCIFKSAHLLIPHVSSSDTATVQWANISRLPFKNLKLYLQTKILLLRETIIIIIISQHRLECALLRGPFLFTAATSDGFFFSLLFTGLHHQPSRVWAAIQTHRWTKPANPCSTSIRRVTSFHFRCAAERSVNKKKEKRKEKVPSAVRLSSLFLVYGSPLVSIWESS